MMDKILPGIIAGITVLAIGFVIFYFFIEYYAKKRVLGDKSIDEKLKILDEVLPLIDDIMKKGFELDNNLTPEYIGSEDDGRLADEIETAPRKSKPDIKEPEPAPVSVAVPEPKPINNPDEKPKEEKLNDLFDNLFEKL
jgi:hypothetical protein